MKTVFSICIIFLLSSFSFAQINGQEFNQDDNLLRTEKNISKMGHTPNGSSSGFYMGTKTHNKPLFIVDDVMMSESDVKQINPNAIESINILKDKNATVLYGEIGKNGVIIIKTKEGKEKKTESMEEIKTDLESQPILAV